MNQTRARLRLTNNYGGMLLVELCPRKKEHRYTVSIERAKNEFKLFIIALQQAILDSFGRYAGYQKTPGVLDNIGTDIAASIDYQERISGFFLHSIKPTCTVLRFREGDMSMQLRMSAPRWMIELVKDSEQTKSSPVP